MKTIQIDLAQLDFINQATIELSHATGRMAKVGPNVAFMGSNRITEDSPYRAYYQLAVDVAEAVGQEGYNCITGGGSGITNAVMEGALLARVKSIALRLVPTEFKVRRMPDVRVKISNPFNRKVLFDLFSEAFVFFPGGFATLDLLFEALTLQQTKKIDVKPIVCMGVDFWKPLLAPFFETCVRYKTIGEKDAELFTITDDPKEVIRIIQKHRRDILKSKGEGGMAIARGSSAERSQSFAHKVAHELSLAFNTFHGVGQGITIFGSARTKPDSKIYHQTVLIAQELGKALVHRREKMDLKGAIITGGGPGSMEAANRGARLAGAPSLGLGIDLAMEQGFNPYVDEDLCYEFRYFFTRKWLFSALTNIFIATPGGFGTLDELFEMIANKQYFLSARSKMAAKSIYCVNKGFWEEPMQNLMERLLQYGFIAKDQTLLEPCLDTEPAIEEIQNALAA